MTFAIKTISTDTIYGIDAVQKMIKKGWSVVSTNPNETMLEKVSSGREGK